MAPDYREFLTVAEAADTTALSDRAIRRAIDDGELTAYKLRTQIRIKRVDFDGWVDSGRVEPRSMHDV